MTDSKQKQSRDWAFTHASNLEDNSEKMYDDGTGVPTIGVGYAAIVKGSNGWAAKETLAEDMRAVGAPLSSQHQQTLKELAKEKNKSNSDQGKIDSLIGSLSEVSLSPEQRRGLYDLSFDRHYKETMRAVGATTFAKIDAKQQAALTLGTFLSPAAMQSVRVEISAGINESNPNKVIGALAQVGTKLKNPVRFDILAGLFTNPDQTGKAPVEPGDYLGKIAQKYGTTVEALRMANPNINEQGTIFSGQALNLPEGAVTKESVYAAYAQQGIAPAEADIHWAEQVKSHKNGARLAALGLTVREARVINDVTEGRDVRGQGYSGPEMAAATRYSSALERTNGNHDVAMQHAREGLAEARTYNGPSQDLSPEDTASVAENRAQLARNTKLREARRTSLLDGGRITIDGVPMNATRTAGTSTAHATRATRAGAQRLYQKGAQRLYQKKAQAIHPDPMAARRAVRTTLPEQVAMPDFAAVYNEAVDGLQSVFGVKTATAKEVTPSRGQLESAKMAGLVMDKPMADKLMKSTAYNTKSDILHDFAAQSARSFYGATYADNDAAAPTRTSAAEEPTRQKAIADAQKVTERHNAQIDKDNASIDRQREAQAAARSKSVSRAAANEEAGIANAVPTRTIKTAKVDLLGDNAVSAAQAAQEDAQTVNVAAAARPRPAKPQMSPAKRAQVLGGVQKQPQNETEKAKSKQPAERYVSTKTRSGNTRHGVRRDKFGREIGAYGQHTRDIMGRKGSGSNGSSSNTRVICTELVRQGRMAPSLQRLDIAFTLRELSPATVRGYHVWAVPYVRLMRNSPLATVLIEPVATWRALEIAHQLGKRDRPHYGGKLVRLVMEPACWALGTVLGWVGDPDRFHPTVPGER